MHASKKSPLRRLPAPLALALYCTLVLLGFWDEPAGYRWMHALLATGLLGVPLGFLISGRRGAKGAGELPLGGGLALLTLVATLVQATGGPWASPLAPATYLLLALLASMQRLPQAGANSLLATAFVAAPFVRAGLPRERLDTLLAQAIFFAFFSLGVGALLGWERRRRHRLESVVRHLQFDRDELRRGSVLGLPASIAEEDESTAESGSDGGPQLPRAIEDDLAALARHLERSFYALVCRLARIASARSCVLYLREGEQMRLREAISAEDLASEVRVAPGQGIVGWVLENAAPVVMNQFDPVRYRLPYYDRRRDVGSFVAVPVPFEAKESSGGGQDRSGEAAGVLCADAPVEDAFSEQHLQIFQLAASQVSEILANAQTMRRAHEEKREFEGLYSFSTLLSGSLHAEEIAPALLRSAAKIVSYDFGAVVLGSGGRGGKPRVRAARGEGAERVEGCPVTLGSSRAGWVLQTGQGLPLSRRTGGARPLLFTKEKLPHFESAVIFPFASATSEGVLGCLVLASRKSRRLGFFELRLLDLLARQAASALLNARLFERMEALATTDGLTGLCNHRTFQERLASELRRAERSGAPLALVLTDIDHFKKFNDTYGHPVGDAVLRHLARILGAGVRDIDLVARYGGEEFVLILPETPPVKAREVCERLRLQVARSRLREGGRELRITLSLGIACYPDHATAAGALIECADRALYRSKDEGRNRVSLWDPAWGRAGEDYPEDLAPTLTAVHGP